MEKKLSIFWKIVSYLLTVFVFLILCGLAVFLEDTFGINRTLLEGMCFFVTMGMYAPIKNILLRYVGKEIDMSKYEFTKPQEITHKLRIATKEIEVVWPSFVLLVSASIKGEFDEMVIKAKKEKKLNLPDDYYVELVCADYVVENYLQNENFIATMQENVESHKQSLEEIKSKLKDLCELAYEEVNSATATDEKTDEEVIKATAKVYAKRIWEGMYEYTAVKGESI